MRWCSSPSVTPVPAVVKKNYSASVISLSLCAEHDPPLNESKTSQKMYLRYRLSRLKPDQFMAWTHWDLSASFKSTASGLVLNRKEQWSTMLTSQPPAAIYSKSTHALHGTVTLQATWNEKILNYVVTMCFHFQVEKQLAFGGPKMRIPMSTLTLHVVWFTLLMMFLSLYLCNHRFCQIDKFMCILDFWTKYYWAKSKICVSYISCIRC